MPTIYVAEARIPGTDPEEWQVFVSLDEKSYLPVTRKPQKETLEDDYRATEELFRDREDEDGTIHGYIKFDRRYLLHQGASFGWVSD